MIGIEERNAVLRVLDKGILSGYQGNWSDAFYGGEEIKALEKEWAEYFGVKHAIAVNSATSGLWIALAAIGLQQNRMPRELGAAIQYIPDEVICSPYSMTCSASIPLHFGAKPVFTDIEADYYCLDVKSIEEHITEHTKAIIVVDIFGQPYNADEINALADKYSKIYGHKIYVIEDAAQAAGAKYKGKYAGTLGDIGVFSLNVHKPIQCGEGGIVVTNNDELAMKLRLSMNHAEAVVNDINRQATEELKVNYADGLLQLVGMNLRMTEISAAIAREQLKKLDGIIKIQQKYAKWFPVNVRPECKHSFYRYAFTDDRFKMEDGVILIGEPNNTEIKSREFNTKNHYITPLFKLPLFKSLGYQDGLCPVCEKVDENIVLAWLKESV